MLRGEGAAYAAFGSENFRRYVLNRMLSMIGGQAFFVAVGWHVYSVTNKLFDLGLVGLAAFLPFFLLTPFGGQLADVVDRKRIIVVSQSCAALVLISLAITSALFDLKIVGVWPIFLAVFLAGALRAFSGPASSSILPALVPLEHLSNAITWSSSAWQLAMVLGPAIGGLVYSVCGSAGFVYLFAGVVIAMGVSKFKGVKLEAKLDRPPKFTWSAFAAGFNYVKQKRVLLGAISLDLFAVLLGGCIALLPAFVSDVLKLGPTALGALRASPAIGAVCMAVWNAHYPLKRGAGRVMLCAIFTFGCATVTFGLSTSFIVAALALVVSGAADMLSVIVRQTLVQVATPDEMRGRVSAVSQVFIGASNELGEFESGVTAAWFGLIPAIVIGGVGTCIVVAIWWRIFPELRELEL